MKIRSFLFSAIFAIAALAAAAPASAEEEPKMSTLIHSGYVRSGRGTSIPVGYSFGFTFAEHVYAGSVLSCILGPFESIGVDAQGQRVKALDSAIFVAGEVGYEQVVQDHLVVRGALGLGGYFWSRQEQPDSEARLHAGGFAIAPSVTIAGLFGPVMFGIQTRGIVGSMPMDKWSFGTLLVVGARFDMAK